jgi:hypothetical protein
MAEMKTFYELTMKQQREMLKFAREKIVEHLHTRVLKSEKSLTGQEIEFLIVAAAEGGTYDDDGRPYVEENSIPFKFQGGCV